MHNNNNNLHIRSLQQEKMTDTFRAATEKVKQSIQLRMAAAAQAEDGELPEGKEVEVAKVHGAKDSPPQS